MNVAHRMSRPALLLALSLLMISFLGACEIYDGDLPPTDELQMPNALAVHPTGKYLYVLNSNYNSNYRQDLGGSLSIVDLEEMNILADRTLCLPSFGSGLAFSASHFGEDEPRFILGVSKSNRGLFTLALNEAGDHVSCTYKGEDIGNTCVSDIAKLKGVSKKHRRLPCEIRDITDDPSAAIAIPPIENVTPMEQDAFMIVGQRLGSIIALNLVDGEIRGHDVQGAQNKQLHLSTIFDRFIGGATAMARHPLTDEIYVSGRNDRTINAVKWLREPTGDPAANDRQGFAVQPALSGRVQLKTNASNLELRALRFSDNGERLYAISRRPGSLFVIDTSLDKDGRPRNQHMHRILVSGQPGSFDLITQEGRTYAYISLFDKRKVAVVDVESGTRVSTIDVGATPYAITADPVRPRVYVALFEDNAVAVIDADPNRPTWNRQIATIR